MIASRQSYFRVTSGINHAPSSSQLEFVESSQVFNTCNRYRYYSTTKKLYNENEVVPENIQELMKMTDNTTPYEKLVRELYLTNLFRPMKLDLEIITNLVQYLNIPTDALTPKIIHVAGSNGKGSTSLKISKALQYNKYKVGLYTSPHISSFRERISINSTPISEQEVIHLLPKIFQICHKHKLQATFFEITTALALLHFHTQKVDYIVLETGLGGRLDATNIFQRPVLSVISTISLEHTHILGDTIEKIAREKAGIMKYNCPVLVGDNVPHDVMRECALQKGAEYYTCSDILSDLKHNTDYDYDEYNSTLSKSALTLLSQSDDNISPTSIQKGIQHRPSCRFEMLTKNGIKVILDIAHNPQALQNLITKLQQTYPNTFIKFICGFSNDKDVSSNLSILLNYPNMKSMHLVQACNGRASTVQDLIHMISDGENIHYNLKDPSVKYQVLKALMTEEEEMIVICGSAFIMSEAREALGVDEARDSDVLMEVYGGNCNFKFMQDNVVLPQDRKV